MKIKILQLLLLKLKRASPSKGILVNNFNHLNIAEEYVKNEWRVYLFLLRKNIF